MIVEFDRNQHPNEKNMSAHSAPQQMRHKKKKEKIALKSPTQERSRHTVSAIIAACSKLLIQEGFFGVTTDKIAKEAGVSIGSLYQFFGNKESVVSAVIQDLFEKDKIYFSEQIKSTQGMSCNEKIRKMVDVGLEIYRTQPELRSKIQSLHIYLTDSRFYSDNLRFYQDLITEIIPPTKDNRSRNKMASVALHAFIGMMNTATKETLDIQDTSTREEIIRFFSHFFENETHELATGGGTMEENLSTP